MHNIKESKVRTDGNPASALAIASQPQIDNVMKIEQGFQQQQPPSLHPFLDDPVLPVLVKRLFPPSSHARVVEELTRFGNDINGYISDLGKFVGPPTLIQYDHFGQRIDQLKTSEGWRQLKQVAAKEGMVPIAYDRANYGSLARVLMFIKTCLWTGDSHTV
ncbi:hypothetical protein RSOLAG1IB_10630 [Rhizoctonia solani AG-1 IB]|uniref:Uncharacterized protein n=1 Tax=Thanatephorus cucumeris (strain AG1-IB / isolate 7/3/14) TaxID=1108050 RepID=A0A0B7G3A2_THACB|nr:hypothetical protein RSOLAG1IB_10630 [Rhizoctonia solani AG-1 IB]